MQKRKVSCFVLLSILNTQINSNSTKSQGSEECFALLQSPYFILPAMWKHRTQASAINPNTHTHVFFWARHPSKMKFGASAGPKAPF